MNELYYETLKVQCKREFHICLDKEGGDTVIAWTHKGVKTKDIFK